MAMIQRPGAKKHTICTLQFFIDCGKVKAFSQGFRDPDAIEVGSGEFFGQTSVIHFIRMAMGEVRVRPCANGHVGETISSLSEGGSVLDVSMTIDKRKPIIVLKPGSPICNRDITSKKKT